jgi:hypothetical protein
VQEIKKSQPLEESRRGRTRWDQGCPYWKKYQGRLDGSLSGRLERRSLLSQIAAGLIIAIVTALVTIRLSLRSFYSEKWWEKKAETYTAVINSLHHMKRYDDMMLEQAFGYGELPADREKELLKRSQESYDELMRLIDVGSFVLAPEAMAELQLLEKEFCKGRAVQSWAEHLETSLAATNACLERLREIGRKDLKVE